MTKQIKIIDILRDIIQEKNTEIIYKLYSQVLHREPQSLEYSVHINNLNTEKDKIKIIAEIIQGKEAINLYKKKQNDLTSNKRTTVASIIKGNYHLGDVDYINFLYDQFLNRKPNQQEVEVYLRTLRNGFPRIKLINIFLLSQEFQTIINSPIRLTQYYTDKQKINVGFFLGFGSKIDGEFESEGIGRFVIRLVQGMLNNIHDVNITITTTNTNYKHIRKTFERYEELFPGRIHTTKFKTVEKLDKILPVDVWVVPYIGMELALNLNKPMIIVLHDLVYKHFDIYYRLDPSFCNKLDKIIYNIANKASVVVSSSNFIRKKDGMEFLKMPLEKTYVIPLAPPVEEYQSYGIIDEAYFRQKYHLYENYIVYPSAIRLHKNHMRLIEAFLKFSQSEEGQQSNLHLILTSKYMYSPLEQDILKLLNSYETLKKRIIFLGKIPANDLPSLYKYAEGTIIPTLFEGSCPFQIFESLTMNTPVAISNIEVVKEVIQDIDSFITFDPYSVHKIEKAICHLWKDKNNIIEKEKCAVSKVFERKWSDVAVEYYSLIKQLIKLS